MLLLDGLNISAWGNFPTGMAAVTKSHNTVPADEIMISMVINPIVKKTKSIFVPDQVDCHIKISGT
jgi:hypothetical protein